MKIFQILAKFDKKLVEMVGKTEKNPQLNMFQVPIKQFINESHELVELTKKIDWESLESELSVYYSNILHTLLHALCSVPSPGILQPCATAGP